MAVVQYQQRGAIYELATVGLLLMSMLKHIPQALTLQPFFFFQISDLTSNLIPSHRSRRVFSDSVSKSCLGSSRVGKFVLFVLHLDLDLDLPDSDLLNYVAVRASRCLKSRES